MEKLPVKTIVKSAISELISSKPFYDVVERNWNENKGAEEELYPYLTEMIRRQLSDYEILGIGWGKIHCRSEKVDCIVYLIVDTNKIAFAIELKGPSKDKAWVERGLKKDIDKLKQLEKDGIIQYGVGAGIWLLDNKENTYQHFENTLQINSCQIGVEVKILDTESNE